MIGYGAPNKQGTAGTHGAPLGDDEVAAARDELGWPHPPFEVPAPILDAWREAGQSGAAARAGWEKNTAALDADTRSSFEQMLSGGLPANVADAVNAHKRELSADMPKWATRKASQEALNVLTEQVPAMVARRQSDFDF